MNNGVNSNIITLNGENGNEVDFKVINFEIDEDILLDRIVNRESCPNCGEIYNRKFKFRIFIELLAFFNLSPLFLYSSIKSSLATS